MGSGKCKLILLLRPACVQAAEKKIEEAEEHGNKKLVQVLIRFEEIDHLKGQQLVLMKEKERLLADVKAKRKKSNYNKIKVISPVGLKGSSQILNLITTTL